MSLHMSPKKLTNFRIDSELLEGLEAVRDRVGTPVSEQVRRAIGAWLVKQGVSVKKPERKRASTRKRS